MSNRREYEIAFVGLKPGVHQFEYIVDNSFFEDFGAQDFILSEGIVKLQLDKSSSFLMLRFQVGGKAQVNCDRCSNELPLQLFEDFTVTVKMSEDPDTANEQEEDPDVYYISRGESTLDVKTWIYEFISLSIPMQKTCEFESMDGPYCNADARAILERIRVQQNEPQQNLQWKGLDKFKNGNEALENTN